jgi:hypothetical protein
MTTTLTLDLASRFARIALDNVVREFPNKLDHVLGGEADVASPRTLHPAFYGSFDWHSCVHMHWLLARSGGSEPFARWSANLAPLADAFVARYLDWLPRASHPLRIGMHVNTAFALAFALDYARFRNERALAQACEARAMNWYGADRDYPASWEPSGADFFSPALIEADLMRRVLPRGAFAQWLDGFLPGLRDGAPATLFQPAVPSDRSDGQIVHLDGLNLSRAWCFAGIAASLPRDDSRIAPLQQAASRHVDAGMLGVASGDYMGAHWLASFAALALTGA